MIAQHELSEDLEHRHFDGLADASALFVKQRGEDCVRRRDTGDLVRDVQRHELRVDALRTANER